MKEYITLTVDGKSVRIEKGSTLLEAARKAGADIRLSAMTSGSSHTEHAECALWNARAARS